MDIPNQQSQAGPIMVPQMQMGSPVQEEPLQQTDDIPSSVRQDVEKWCTKIRAAKVHWTPDFERIEDNRRFACGKQWQGQEEMNDERYTVNLVLQVVNQKVAALYARNPTVKFSKRERLLHQVWDGRLETLAVAIMKAQSTGMQDMEAVATVLDYENGRRIKELLDKVGKTLEILYKVQCDFLEPDFKEQMKQLVRRVCICGIGWVKQSFVNDAEENPIQETELQTSVVHRMATTKHLMRQIVEGEFGEDDARIEQLKQLLLGIQASQPYDMKIVNERLMFNFPSATSIIPDIHCTQLKGFINADWVAEEHVLSLDKANAFFSLNLSNLDVTKIFHPDGQEIELHDMKHYTGNLPSNPHVCVWEVYDKTTKSFFFICDGYTGYLQSPQPVEPCTKHFWPWFGLTFNDVDADLESRVSPFPPSDVQQMLHPQKEWNRTRNELRAHRMANAPRMVAKQGMFTEADKDKLMNSPSTSVIELEAKAQDMDLAQIMSPIPKTPVDPALYDSGPLMQDILMSTGQQEADFGVPQRGSKKGETATAASIAEQSKVSKSASNVDDLDGLLDELAKNGGELLLYEMSPETVQRIVGPGAVWPIMSKEDFVNFIFLTVEAASSGRPNKAIEVANWERLAPILMQMGANPHALVRETVKRLDDRLDVDSFFPLTPPTNVPPSDPFGQPRGEVGQSAGPQPNGQAGQSGPAQPPQGQSPVPSPQQNSLINQHPMNPAVQTR